MPSSEMPMPLPALLDLTGADALHAALQQRLSEGKKLCIDGSHVERISTACVQLLVAAALSARGRNHSFELTTPSTVLHHAVRDLGLCAVLGLEAA